MSKRKPQARCRCGHAKSKHGQDHVVLRGIDYSGSCCYCFDRCMKFQMDNLATLERLNAFKESKEEEIKEELSL